LESITSQLITPSRATVRMMERAFIGEGREWRTGFAGKC
jgi:hypothetical protein